MQFHLRELLRTLSLLCVLSSFNACGPRATPKAPPKTEPQNTAVVDPDAWRAKPPAPGPGALPEFPIPETAELKNGLRVYAVERSAPVVSLSLVVRHGASSVPKGKSGLAGLTARMLTEGTRKKSSLALAEAAEALGSTLQSDASREFSEVAISTLTQDAGLGLELLAEVVKEPLFSPKEFDRVRAEWLDGILAERQSPGRLASLVGLRAAIGMVSGAPVSGSIPDVQKLSVKDLIDFHRRAYVPSNVALFIVGNVKLAELLPRIEQLFGKWQGTPFPAPTTAEVVLAPENVRVLLVDRPEAVQSALFAIQSFPKRSEPGHEAREVLTSVVGGLFTSRLNQNLREKHAYTYGARAQAIATRLWGAFVVSTSVKTEATAAALEQTIKELRAARDPAIGKPFRDDEVGRAKADLIHSLGAQLELGQSLAGTIRELYVHELELRYFATYPKLLMGIGSADVSSAATALTPDRLTVVIVGDRSKIEGGLKNKGFMIETAKPELLE